MTVSECCLIKLLPYILFEKKHVFLALKVASAGNQHCANRIGALSFRITQNKCFFLSNYRINGRNSTRFLRARTAAERTTISDEARGGQLLPGFICGRRAAPRDTLIRAAVWRLAGQPVAMVICRRREILCRDNACLIPPSNYAGSPTHRRHGLAWPGRRRRCSPAHEHSSWSSPINSTAMFACAKVETGPGM